MSHFRARRRGGVLVELPPYAAGLLSSLAAQLVELLSDGEALSRDADDPLEALLDFDGQRDAPDDPALRRLLPDASRDDVEIAAEFRRYTERSLREAKVADAMAILDKVGVPPGDESESDIDDVEFELTAQQARAWMRSLTDMRLTMAERLGVTADDDDFWANLPTDDPRLPVHEIYGWLGFLLESLIDAVRR